MQDQSMVELLESRRMFAGVSLKAGIIRVYGDTAGDNVINVSVDNTLHINVSIAYTDAAGIDYTFTAAIPSTPGIRKVNIFGGSGADHVSVNGKLPTQIDTGAGDDTVNTAGERDAIYAGDGDDTVASGSGDDIVYGERGNDVLIGGKGNDTLLGGSGGNDLEGGRGNDTIGGLLGTANTLLGGSGHDTFVVASISVAGPNDFNALEDTVVSNNNSDIDTPPVATPH